MNTYSTIIAYHGCEKSLALDVLQGKDNLKKSKNNYDWLGEGIYFWENDIKRAYHWAQNNKNISEPFVIGSIIQCNSILDLATIEATEYLEIAYNNLSTLWGKLKISPTENSPFKDGDTDFKNRKLDCAVVNYLCITLEFKTKNKIEAVLSPFFEGKEVYPTSMFKQYTHTQIAVRDPKCILGYFLPIAFLKKNKLL